MCQSLNSPTAESNSTLVPINLVPSSYPRTQFASSSRVLAPAIVLYPPVFVRFSENLMPRSGFSRKALLAERLDMLPAVSIALSITITLGRRSSVAERGSHNP
jgi:hypothetical protein